MSLPAFHRPLTSGIVIATTRAEHAPALERLQELCFPTLAPEERFCAPHYRRHIELFPEGQLVALDGARVVGSTSTVRLHELTATQPHTFAEVIQGGWLTSHAPDGEWLYGADIGTHPDERKRGIARGLYAGRHLIARALGLRGQITVGMLRGYGAVKSDMSAEHYYQEVVRGERVDATISAQMRIGFQPRGLVPGYLSDPMCDGYGVLLVLEAAVDVPAPWTND